MYGYTLVAKGLQWERDFSGATLARWLPSSNGVFTTKSAYNLVSPVPSEATSFNWRRLWQFMGPARPSFTLWLAAHNRLKTGALLWEWSIIESPECDQCGAPYETTLHAVRDCHLPRQIWENFVPPQFWQEFWAPSCPSEWIQANLRFDPRVRSNGHHWKYIFRQTLHEVWFWRNHVLFRNLHAPTSGQVIKQILTKSLEVLRMKRPGLHGR